MDAEKFKQLLPEAPVESAKEILSGCTYLLRFDRPMPREFVDRFREQLEKYCPSTRFILVDAKVDIFKLHTTA
jgi:hypothetical protein